MDASSTCHCEIFDHKVLSYSEKIRIKKKFLNETTQPPMGRTSVRTPTQKIGSKTKKLTYDVPQDVRNQLQQMYTKRSK